MSTSSIQNLPFTSSFELLSLKFVLKNNSWYSLYAFVSVGNGSSPQQLPRSCRLMKAATATAMETEQSRGTAANSSSNPPMKLLFVEMSVGYDQHGQDVTAAAMKACRDAISSNSIPAFRRGCIPGVSFEQMKILIKLGVPSSLQQL